MQGQYSASDEIDGVYHDETKGRDPERHSDLPDAFYGEVLLNWRLIGAKHAGPVHGTSHYHWPKRVSNRWVRIHAKNIHILIKIPYRFNDDAML